MKSIFMHEYTYTPWDRVKRGITEVKIIIISESKERDNFAIEKLFHNFEKDYTGLNVSHKLLLEGYEQE